MWFQELNENFLVLCYILPVMNMPVLLQDEPDI
jgi:hypothetical protein